MFHLFHKDIVDLSQDKYTQGFSDGYKTGRVHQREANEEQMKLLSEEIKPGIAVQFTEFPMLIDMEQVLTAGNGKVFLNGVELEQNKLDRLKQEVNMLGNSMLWDVITNTIRHQAEKIGWERSKDTTDLMNAKMMVRTIDIQNNIIQKIKDAK